MAASHGWLTSLPNQVRHRHLVASPFSDLTASKPANPCVLFGASRSWLSQALSSTIDPLQLLRSSSGRARQMHRLRRRVHCLRRRQVLVGLSALTAALSRAKSASAEALQHVRVSFIPTEKKDIRDLGSMEERTVDGKYYWTFEYELESPSFSRTAFATIAIGNGRYYTLVVGANERRWTRLRNKLKVVADSFRILDI
ncbi:GAD domain [Musa troglodytarum]|uniref:GAD domain n=1 Tax=Musa troglodytarum TaxID=320322 RepID=A0A9E7GUY5_9LILI|nr:GAD domain [Musa troglodytarum]